MSLPTFWANVRRGVGGYSFRCIADCEQLSPDSIANLLRTNTPWLTPISVAGYDEADFSFLPKEERERLTHLVNDFRQASLQVSPLGPSTPQEVEPALPIFRDIAVLLEFDRYGDGEALRIGKLIEARIKPWRSAALADLRFQTGYDHAGDPGIWIWDILDIDLEQDEARFHREARGAEELLQAASREIAPHLFPYAYARTVAEQKEILQEQVV